MFHKFYSMRKHTKILNRSLNALGIGSGGEVFDSGEEIAFNILLKNSYFSNKTSFCIFDAGANVGKYTTLCLRHMGGGQTSQNKNTLDFKIHCFEPSHYTFEKLLQTHSNNEKVILNNFGLSNAETKATLYSNADGSGLASLTKRRLDHFNIDFNKTEQIQLSTLDTYCKTQNISHIDLLKLDVEGHELDVLDGAKVMFANKAIDMVTFEFGGCNIDTRTFFQDFWYFFSKNDMAIYRILPNATLYHIDSYRETDEQFITTNYIAITKKCKIDKDMLAR